MFTLCIWLSIGPWLSCAVFEHEKRQFLDSVVMFILCLKFLNQALVYTANITQALSNYNRAIAFQN